MTISERPGQNEYQQMFVAFTAELDRLAPVGQARFTNVSAQLLKETPFSRITIQRETSINIRGGVWVSKKPGPPITTVMLRSREKDASLRLHFPARADRSSQVEMDEVPNDFIDEQTGMPVEPFVTSRINKPVRRKLRRKDKSFEAQDRHEIVGDLVNILQTLKEDDMAKSKSAEQAEAESVGRDFKKHVEPRLEDLLRERELLVSDRGVKYKNGSFLNDFLVVQKIIEKRQSEGRARTAREAVTYVVVLFDSLEEALAAQPNLPPQDLLAPYRKYLWAGGESKSIIYYGKGYSGLENASRFGIETKAGIEGVLTRVEDAQPLFDALHQVNTS
jgi:hypothetical protein